MPENKKQNLFFKTGLLILIITVFFIGLLEFGSLFELNDIFSGSSNFRKIITSLENLNRGEAEDEGGDLIWKSPMDMSDEKDGGRDGESSEEETVGEKTEDESVDPEIEEMEVVRESKPSKEEDEEEAEVELKSFGMDIVIEEVNKNKIVGAKNGLEIDFYFTENYKVQINPIAEREEAIEKEAQKYLDEDLCPKVEQEIVENYRLKESSFEDIKKNDKAHVRGDYKNGRFFINRIILLR